jgi:hypothetical protein
MKLRFSKGKSVLLTLVTILRLVLLAHPAACLLLLVEASAKVALLATMHAEARGGSLADCDFLYLEQMALGGLLHRRLPLLRQLGLDLNDHMVLMVPAPMLVGDGHNGRRCPVRHRRCLNGAGALLLQVDLLGFPPEESVNICLDLVV